MRVVDLHDGIVRQIVQVAAPLDGLSQDELGGVAHHEVLLIDAQQAPVLVRVVGIEEQREVAPHLPLVELDGVVGHKRIVHADQVKEAQAVLGLSPIAQDIDGVELGRDGEVSERDLEGLPAADEDVLLAQPCVGKR